jgi:NAD+--asparagine ADP-ribosyltransferase
MQNFHSEAKKLDSLFPKAKKSKYYDNSNMNDVMEDKGVDIAGWAKWDGHDILDAFSYYTSMTIGGGFGSKLESLKESISELIESEMLAEASYSSKLTEGKFKVDDLVYNKRTKTVGIVRMGDDKYGEVKN